MRGRPFEIGGWFDVSKPLGPDVLNAVFRDFRMNHRSGNSSEDASFFVLGVIRGTEIGGGTGSRRSGMTRYGHENSVTGI